MERTLRGELVNVVRRLAAEGLVRGTSGNASARPPAADYCLVTPSGVEYAGMRPEDIVAVALAGGPAPAGGTPSSDTPNHLALYAARADIRAVVHTHSPFATAFAVVGEPIPAVVAEAAGVLGGAVPIMDPVPLGSPDLARYLVEALGPDRAVLMPNHGVTAVGEDLSAAFRAAAAVEEAARIAWLARAIGTPRTLADRDVAWMQAFLRDTYGQR